MGIESGGAVVGNRRWTARLLATVVLVAAAGCGGGDVGAPSSAHSPTRAPAAPCVKGMDLSDEDDEIVSLATIDWRENPAGIDGRAGVQINGIGSLQETQDLAESLRIGPAPLDLELVDQR